MKQEAETMYATRSRRAYEAARNSPDASGPRRARCVQDAPRRIARFGAARTRNSGEARKQAILLVLPATAFVISLAVTVRAGDPQAFEVPWHTIDGGGGVSSGGAFTVSGTIGQPDAGVLTGGDFEVTGGFWAAARHSSVPGDCTGDAELTLSDYACYFDCLVGPGRPVGLQCDPFDMDRDGDVDAADFGDWQARFRP